MATLLDLTKPIINPIFDSKNIHLINNTVKLIDVFVFTKVDTGVIVLMLLISII